MAEKTKVGIATHTELRERALQIARGERRRLPDEPQIWFTSLESLAKVLSEPNRRLLRIIDEQHPASLAELEVMSGRKASNLSRTLKTMSQYGLVRLVPGKRGSVAPEVLVRGVQMDLSIVG
ncbi:transcriptional regulator [Paramagnetospirillum magneticum]|uniref:Predicted transcriptional regulator n=1 Tax=Paramagnetospirillum magneticum (strain ATCC 700264 / AMB-1) TaxID=342108 RepID=Q2W2D7_PARM1|nr:transcriptional regulator [Paramagnetospirillum magneticum]BAE51988.1 Predicted transcriptional regulator [Paramagnetospirillum magneticum AMB-1]